MISISPTDVVKINKDFNNASSPWVTQSLLDSAFSSYMYYDTEIEQICSIFRGIVKNHAFSDGNKRTASAVLMIFLEQNNYSMLSEDLCDFTLDVSINNYSVEDIVNKLKPLLNHN